MRYEQWQTLIKEQQKGMPARPVPSPAFDVMIAQAQTVVSHPGWQLFLNAVAARIETLEAIRKALTRNLLDNDAINADALLELRAKLRYNSGELAGLKFATELIPSLLELGETSRAAAEGHAGKTARSREPAAEVTGAEESSNA